MRDADHIDIDEALQIVERLKDAAKTGAPTSMPRRSLSGFLTRELAKAIAFHPSTQNGAYIKELMDSGFTKRNARAIVFNARKLAATIEVPVVVQQPAASPAPAPVVAPAPATAPTSGGGVVVGKEKGAEATASVAGPTPAAEGRKPNLLITYENNSYALGHLSDYVLAIPETLPRPSRILPFEANSVLRKKTTLKSIRKDLFTQEYGLTSRLENRSEITAMNPRGFFEPNGHAGAGPAAIEDFNLFSSVRTAIGEWRIAQPQLAEFLPYLADEGLLEYHAVSLKAIRKLEDMRQRLIANGTIQEYDRNVPPALPMPKRP
ncbi:hypothetical protein HFU84_13345 [Acidithiobacillus sp. CV18-2]|nr:hypothetical protein [Acidithiobacillus sp. CV18-3]MBU2758007.1 hypothetical protein [Acidithiobacillus sp. BN09-2]MBU2778458.1 hypothetical protein [Acidithiobacillus sp. CV18-2]MBU2800549.1 hypothetical protein [Acidithiobacillus sp. VAN18-4]